MKQRCFFALEKKEGWKFWILYHRATGGPGSSQNWEWWWWPPVLLTAGLPKYTSGYLLAEFFWGLFKPFLSNCISTFSYLGRRMAMNTKKSKKMMSSFNTARMWAFVHLHQRWPWLLTQDLEGISQPTKISNLMRLYWSRMPTPKCCTPISLG